MVGVDSNHLFNGPTKVPHRRAAAYVRMSTDHQKYSTDNQMDAIRDYATKNNIEIVRVFADEGKSGMQAKGRDAFQAMIRIVGNGHADFDLIIAYDHSRWGRFQQNYEGAHYAYLCVDAGVDVHFCAGGISNDMGPFSEVMWTINSTQASNYSRDLSAKVWIGQCRLIRLGYRQGGTAGYGLRRILLDERGAIKCVLKRGERKSLQTDRVVLAPGPDAEIRQVRWIYDQFAQHGQTEAAIARAMNARGLVNDMGRPWTGSTVHQVLTNEKYIGNNVYNRTSGKLTAKRRSNAPADWVRAEGAFPPVVSQDAFIAAQTIIKNRNRHVSDADMLQRLAQLLQKHGTLSGFIIDEADGMPSAGAYQSRFGSLIRAYELIGFTPDRDYRYIEVNRTLRRLHRQTITATVDGLRAQGNHVTCNPVTDLITLNGEISTSIVIARSYETGTGLLRWKVRFDTSLGPDVTIAVRMNRANDGPLDYYFLPRSEMTGRRLGLSEENGFMLDTYRHENLENFIALTRRSTIAELASW